MASPAISPTADEEGEPLALAFARHLASVTLERTTTAGVRTAMAGIIDTVAVTLAGAPEPAVRIVRETLGDAASDGPSLIFGDGRRTDVLNAALINGVAAHAIDYDDMASAMGGHPSVPIVPVVFALSEFLDFSGVELLDAYIVGFEAECRLGRAVHPHHYGAGWHPTSTLGVFGAGAAAARLLSLDVTQTATVIALCASIASGVKANFGTMTKPLHVGRAAHDGLMAALLVKRGFTAKLNALEQKEGFFAAFDGLTHVHPHRMMANLGGPLEIEARDIGLKQFPCCGSTHPAILAMLQLVEREQVSAADVTAIQIRAHKARLPHTHNPEPTTALGAKFSIQYAAVRALLSGAPRLDDFEGDAFLDPEVRRLLKTVTVEALPEGAGDVSDQFAAEVGVRTRDGRDCVSRVVGALGRGPENPMSAAEMWTKFEDCAASVMPSRTARSAFDALSGLPEAPRIRAVTDILAQARLPADAPSRAEEIAA